MKDFEQWAQRYGTPLPEERYKTTFLFGSNPEVEDAMINAGVHNLLVFDDRVEYSLMPCQPWTTGLGEIMNNPEHSYFLVCGVASTPRQRARAIQHIEKVLVDCRNWAWTNVRASTAYISPAAKIGNGVLVLDTVYLGPLAELRDHAVMLPGAKLYHHGLLGRYSILVGGSTSLGHAKVREGSRVCGNAVVFPHAEVGPGETVAALSAAMVKKDNAEAFCAEFGRDPE